MKLVFATNNPNKIAEVKAQLGDQYQFLSLRDIGCTEEIPETTGTLEGNASQKANHVYDNYGQNCFSEDTGLEIEALGGAPGVDTAYYAGPQRDATDNMDRVLGELAGTQNRHAEFRTVISLIIDGEEKQFEGIIKGRIAEYKQGEQGFGYDPIFIPEGHSRSFAEMTKAEKHPISHRGRAVAKLIAYLKQLPAHG